jgi:hypothetical protein
VRVLSGPYAPADLDITKEKAVAKAELAEKCTRPVAMARALEFRRGDSILNYSVEVVDVQRLCRKYLEVQKARAERGGSADQLEFKKSE